MRGKTVVITGGASGIGLATAKHFARKGATIIIVDKSNNSEQAISEVQNMGVKCLFFQTDISVEEEVKDLMQKAVEACSSIDVLVNNAAIFYNSIFTEESTDKWKKVFNVIVDGTYFCTKYAAKEMKEKGTKGSIINVSSINAHRALEWSSHYNAAKGAVDQLTKCTALELSDYGIRVNAVAPGFIDTPMSIVDGVKEHETEDFQAYYVGKRKIPLRRSGSPEEVANVIGFLASEEASYIQGAIIPVDGGLSTTF